MTHIKRLNENSENVAFGSNEITRLLKTLGPDEDIWLDDSTGDLSGRIVKKSDYVTRMLNDAIRDKDWEKVRNAMLYLKTKM
jgi:hypothetical protein